MSSLSALLAALAALAMALPDGLWVLAFAAATLAVGAGAAAYRARESHASRRLLGALAASSGGIILAVATTKVALTLVAAERISAALGG